MTYGLGRRVNHDPRSRNFAIQPVEVHRPIRHRHYGPVLDQGELGSCTGNATAQVLNTRPLHRVPSRLLRQADAVNIYSQATRLDPFPGEYPPEDTGSSGLAVAKVAKNMGLIREYRHAFGLNQMISAVQQYPVIVGTVWLWRMFEPDSQGFIHPDGREVGGHEWAVIGDNPAKEYFIGLNSWGSGWGKNGRFYVSYEDMDALLRADGDVTVLIP